MKIKKTENSYIVSLESESAAHAAEQLESRFNELKDGHIILDLSKSKISEISDLLHLITLSTQHKLTKKSFVIVTDLVDIDKVPEELAVAPSLQEAYDIIEMEDIERDLGF